MDKLFRELLEAFGPSGFETRVQKIVENSLQGIGSLKRDTMGNLIVQRPNSEKKVMMIAHNDEIGLMIHHIDDNGFLRFKMIGGIDPQILAGIKVKILHTDSGKKIRGIIGKKAIHLIPPKDRDNSIKTEDLYIDIGAETKAEAEPYVSVGDPIVFDSEPVELLNGNIASKTTDNRSGVFACIHAMQELSKIPGLSAQPIFVSSVQEEIGTRGATTATFGIDPDVAIAIDVTHAIDTPDTDKTKNGEIYLGKGAVIPRGANINPIVFDLLVQAAKNTGVKYQIEAAPGVTGTDARITQITKDGIPTGLVKIPCRYMHTPNEVVNMNDIEAVVKILVEFNKLIMDETDFIPK